MKGYLTYTSIVASAILIVGGNFFTQEEATQVSVALLTLVSLGVASYGRYRATIGMTEKPLK